MTFTGAMRVLCSHKVSARRMGPAGAQPIARAASCILVEPLVGLVQISLFGRGRVKPASGARLADAAKVGLRVVEAVMLHEGDAELVRKQELPNRFWYNMPVKVLSSNALAPGGKS